MSALSSMRSSTKALRKTLWHARHGGLEEVMEYRHRVRAAAGHVTSGWCPTRSGTQTRSSNHTRSGRIVGPASLIRGERTQYERILPSCHSILANFESICSFRCRA